MASACAERNAICSLEMGGKNVIMVMDDADMISQLKGRFGARLEPRDSAALLIATRVHKKVYNSFEEAGGTDAGVAHRQRRRSEDRRRAGVNADAVKKIMSYIDIGREKMARPSLVAANA